MFEHETDLIITSIRQRTPGNNEVIAVKDILAADIPHAIKTFFRADVQTMLTEELQKYQTNSRFRYDHPEVQSLQTQINSILVLHYSYKHKEYLQRLSDIVHLMVNYLIRPQWTLTSALFEREQSISYSTVIQFLNYFGPYEYLRDILIRYIHDKHISTLTKEEFASLIWRVDGEYIKRKSGDELARVLFPIYDFFDFPKKGGNNPARPARPSRSGELISGWALPLKALMKYFEDKGLTAVLSHLEGLLAQGITEMNRREVGEMLEDVRRTSGAFEVEKKVDPTEAQSDNTIQIQNQSKGEQPPPSEAVQKPSTSPSSPVLINDGDRRRFVKKIFKHDESGYLASIETLNTLPSWKQASTYIDEIFIQNDIDPYSSEAKRFIEVVYQRYYPKSK